MCFYISRKHPNIKIAKKDIICYKKVDRSSFKNVFYSNVRSHTYNFDKRKTFYAKRFSYGVDTSTIYRGLYSYTYTKQILKHILNYRSWNKSHAIIKFIIPKGTPYYVNEQRHEYVSLKLKYVKTLGRISKNTTK